MLLLDQKGLILGAFVVSNPTMPLYIDIYNKARRQRLQCHCEFSVLGKKSEIEWRMYVASQATFPAGAEMLFLMDVMIQLPIIGHLVRPVSRSNRDHNLPMSLKVTNLLPRMS